MYVCVVHKGKKRAQIAGTEVTDNCEPLCGCWEMNLGRVQEQQVFLLNNLARFLLFFKKMGQIQFEVSLFKIYLPLFYMLFLKVHLMRVSDLGVIHSIELHVGVGN